MSLAVDGNAKTNDDPVIACISFQNVNMIENMAPVPYNEQMLFIQHRGNDKSPHSSRHTMDNSRQVDKYEIRMVISNDKFVIYFWATAQLKKKHWYHIKSADCPNPEPERDAPHLKGPC